MKPAFRNLFLNYKFIIIIVGKMPLQIKKHDYTYFFLLLHNIEMEWFIISLDH